MGQGRGFFDADSFRLEYEDMDDGDVMLYDPSGGPEAFMMADRSDCYSLSEIL